MSGPLATQNSGKPTGSKRDWGPGHVGDAMHGDSAAQMMQEVLRVVLFLEASRGYCFGLPTDPPISELICSNERYPNLLSSLMPGTRDDNGHKESLEPTTEPVTVAFHSRTQAQPQPRDTRRPKPFLSQNPGSRAQLPGHVGSDSPPQLVVTGSSYPGSDKRGVSQEGYRCHGVSREVGVHRAQNDIQEGLCGHTDT